MKQIKVTKNGVLTNLLGYETEQEIEFFHKQEALGTFGEDYIVEIYELVDNSVQEAINAEALAYLAATDYLIIREIETGVPCSEEIKEARQAARDKVVR